MAGSSYRYHRTFFVFNEPTRIEDVLVFAQLGAVALMPYALEVVLKFKFGSSDLTPRSPIVASIVASRCGMMRRGAKQA